MIESSTLSYRSEIGQLMTAKFKILYACPNFEENMHAKRA